MPAAAPSALSEALHRGLSALTEQRDLPDYMALLLDLLEPLLRFDAGVVLQRGDDHVVVLAARGYAPACVAERYALDEQPGLRYMLDYGEPLLVDNVLAYPDWQVGPRLDRRRSLLGYPVAVDGHVEAFIVLDSLQLRGFSEAQLETVQVFADQASLALTLAALRDRGRMLDLMVMRQRAAGTAHSSLQHILVGARLLSDLMPSVVASKRNPSAELRLLNELLVDAAIEARLLQIELFPETMDDVPLASLVDLLSEAARKRSEVPVSVEVLGTLPVLPPAVKLGLFRIIQEALQNALTYAEGSQIVVRLRATGTGIAVDVIDDGRGFDLNLLPIGHFGVQIMQEQATAIGATVKIESEPGGGTRVGMCWDAPVSGGGL